MPNVSEQTREPFDYPVYPTQQVRIIVMDDWNMHRGRSFLSEVIGGVETDVASAPGYTGRLIVDLGLGATLVGRTFRVVTYLRRYSSPTLKTRVEYVLSGGETMYTSTHDTEFVGDTKTVIVEQDFTIRQAAHVA
jgi:hypothetical protein